MPHLLLKKQWLKVLRHLRKIARSRGSSHSIALGGAIGFLIGMEPIMGIQMVVSIFLATVLKANRLAAIVPVWISNPATFIPLYGFNYWVGYKLTGWGPSLSEYEKVLKRAQEIAMESKGAGFSGSIHGFFSGIYDASSHLASTGWGALWSLLIGCTAVGLVCALISYPIILRLVETVRKARERKRLARHKRVQDDIKAISKRIEKKKTTESDTKIRSPQAINTP